MEKKIGMEVSRLAEHLPDALNKDIEKLLNFILAHYDVYNRGSNCLVNQDEIQQAVMSHLNILGGCVCLALTKAGTQCSRKVTGGNKYCKMHMQKGLSMSHNLSLKSVEFFEIIQPPITPQDDDLKQKFIDDSLYWVDDQFIYDFQSKIKVGYINQNEYIISDDPFLLSM